MLLVVDNIKNGHDIEGKVLSPTELADLNGARQCLRDLATEKNVGLFPDVESAIDACIAHFAQLNIGKCQSKLPCRKKRDASTLKGRGICFDVTDDSEESYVGHGSLTSSQSIVKRPRLQWLGIYLRGSVYVGGNLTATSWRKNVAIPMLHRAGIPVIVPVVDYLQIGLSSRVEKLGQTRADYVCETKKLKATAELILFMIPKNLRSIAGMTEAVELVLSSQALLLVIEPMEEGDMVEDGVFITGREFQDLARARAYLREMAERNDVDVFTSVTKAVEVIVARAQRPASVVIA